MGLPQRLPSERFQIWILHQQRFDASPHNSRQCRNGVWLEIPRIRFALLDSSTVFVYTVIGPTKSDRMRITVEPFPMVIGF